jgi:hypothetical protein
MSQKIVTRLEHEADALFDRLGESATEIVGSAAGTVVEPGKGFARLRDRIVTPTMLLVVLAAFLILVVRRLRQ